MIYFNSTPVNEAVLLIALGALLQLGAFWVVVIAALSVLKAKSMLETRPR